MAQTRKDKKDSIRENWGKTYTVLPKLDLIEIQKESYRWFLEKGILEVLLEISPVEDFTEKNWTLVLKDYRIGKPSNSPVVCLGKG